MKLSLSLQQDFQAPELVIKRAYIKKVVETALRHMVRKVIVKLVLPVSTMMKATN